MEKQFRELVDELQKYFNQIGTFDLGVLSKLENARKVISDIDREITVQVKIRFSGVIKNRAEVIESISDALIRQVQEVGIAPKDEETATTDIFVDGKQIYKW